MYISVGSAPDFSSFNTAFMPESLTSAKCNALAVKNAISVVMPTYSIFNSFLFPTFPITFLHSFAAEPRVFCENSTVGPLTAAIGGRLDKKDEQIWSKPGSIWSCASSRSHDVETPAGGRYVSRAGKA
jgi:hypothetical protein